MRHFALADKVKKAQKANLAKRAPCDEFEAATAEVCRIQHEFL